MMKVHGFIKFVIFAFIVFAVFSYNKLLGLALILIVLAVLAYLKRASWYSYKGNKAYASGNIDEAIIQMEKAIAVKNSKPMTAVGYAFMLLKNKRTEEAETVLQNLLKKELSVRERNSARINYSLVKWKQGKLNESIALLEKVYEEFKCKALYQNYGYMLILKGDYEKALKINLEGYDYDSSDAIIKDNLGESYYYLKDYDKAYEIYTSLMDKNPSFAEAYYYFALVLREKGENDKALELLNKALTLKESFVSSINHEKIKKAIEEMKEYSK